MADFTLKEILEITGGESLNFTGSRNFSEFEFDTRNISKDNTLFFALNSDSGDGHRFVPGLESFNGAAAVVDKNFDT